MDKDGGKAKEKTYLVFPFLIFFLKMQQKGMSLAFTQTSVGQWGDDIGSLASKVVNYIKHKGLDK